ncbi:ABC transporter substrate-binding protein [Geminicoccus roseus]|uniref:ABC transporter substrate-binding protein n=1 Tax=Geminicoccus roseus TaxID=404900 RepID=UPI0003F5A309|nr:ABC transporter substrate-binding protein [Geminicoccus roseus]
MRWSDLLLGSALALAAMGGAALGRDTVALGVVLEPPHLDPTAGAAAAIDEIVYANLFQGLTRIDDAGMVQPQLAEYWTISEDGLNYTFHLKEGVTFHDGSAFDSADVKFTIERALAKDSVNAQKGLFEPIESVETPDPLTALIRLKRPTGQFIWNLAWGDAVMVAPESADTNKTSPVGTGPFRFEEWRQGDRVVLTRREGADVPLAKVTFRFIADPAGATAAMMAEDVDAFSNFPAPEALPQFEADPRFTVVVGTTEGETILAINNAAKPFDDVRVRRAIGHAIDRQALIEGAMMGYGIPIGSHFSPSHPAYVDLTGTSAYDPDRARQLLAEAGVEDLQVTIKLPPPSYARRSGEIVQAQLAEIGIQAELEPMEWAQWLEQVFTNKDYQLTIVSHTEPLDIDIYARDDYYFNFNDQGFRTLVAEVKETTDEAQRNVLYGEAQEMLAEKAVNAFLFELPKHGLWNAKLEGMWVNAPIQANDMTGVRWQE